MHILSFTRRRATWPDRGTTAGVGSRASLLLKLAALLCVVYVLREPRTHTRLRTRTRTVVHHAERFLLAVGKRISGSGQRAG